MGALWGKLWNFIYFFCFNYNKYEVKKREKDKSETLDRVLDLQKKCETRCCHEFVETLQG